jgi:hypothetical protein
MSTEFVTSPNKGVLLSLASHYLLSGHKVCLTLDVIKENSPAHQSLEGAFNRETFRKDLRRGSPKHRAYEQFGKAAQALENRINSTVLPDWLPDMTNETKELLREQLRTLAHHLKSMVSYGVDK